MASDHPGSTKPDGYLSLWLLLTIVWFAANSSQISAGLGVLAVPVLDDGGYPIAAISVAAPSVVCSAAEMEQAALTKLRVAARDIAKVMQMSGSSRVG